MTHLSLFSGIGGADLAAEWAGFETVAFCERDKFCQKVLKKHWPNVPIVGDIKDFNGKEFSGVTVLSGGFPCQPFSSAGKRKGDEDSRYLFPEMLRVISEAEPTWVIGENVAGLLSMGELENILLSLESATYEIWPVVLPACAVSAPHQRNRIFILAYSRSCDDKRRPKRENNGIRSGEFCANEQHDESEVWSTAASCDRGVFGNDGNADKSESQFNNSADERPTTESGRHNAQDVSTGQAEFSERFEVDSNSNSEMFWEPLRREQRRESQLRKANLEFERPTQPDWNRGWIEVATELCRVDDGLSKELDKGARLKALGNAIVPQQIYPIFKAIADIENGVIA